MILDLGVTKVSDLKETDSIGSKYYLETGVHSVTIKQMYLDTSESGAKTIITVCLTKDGTIVSLRNLVQTKKGVSFYIDRSTKEKRPLIALLKINALIKLATGQDLGTVDWTDGLVSKRVGGADKEVTLPVFTGIVGKELELALWLRVGKYQGKTTYKNDLQKALNAEGLTENEETLQSKDSKFVPSFKVKWLANNSGKTYGENGFQPLSQEDVATLTRSSTAPITPITPTGIVDDIEF